MADHRIYCKNCGYTQGIASEMNAQDEDWKAFVEKMKAQGYTYETGDFAGMRKGACTCEVQRVTLNPTQDTPVNGKLIKLKNRRVALFDYNDGYVFVLKRLAYPEEIAAGEPKVKDSIVSLSQEAAEAMLKLLTERLGFVLAEPKKKKTARLVKKEGHFCCEKCGENHSVTVHKLCLAYAEDMEDRGYSAVGNKEFTITCKCAMKIRFKALFSSVGDKITASVYE